MQPSIITREICVRAARRRSLSLAVAMNRLAFLLLVLVLASCSGTEDAPDTTPPGTTPPGTTAPLGPGPYGGEVFALAEVGGELLATTQVGVFVSADSGRSWQFRSNPHPFIKQLYSDGTRLWAITAGGTSTRSFDAGRTWEPDDSWLLAEHEGTMYSVRRFPDSVRRWNAATAQWDDLLARPVLDVLRQLVVSDQGFFLTNDLGEFVHWDGAAADFVDATFDTHPGVVLHHIEKTASSLVMITAAGRLYTSEDGGRTWASRPSNLGELVTADAPACRLVSVGDALHVVAYGALHVSTDAGASWQSEDVSAATKASLGCGPGLAHAGELYVGGKHGVHRLTPAGLAPLNIGLTGHALAGVVDGAGRLFAWSPEGVWQAQEGSWAQIHEGVIRSAVADGETLFVASGGELGRMSGTEWQPIDTLPRAREGLMAIAAAGGVLFAALDTRLVRSVDGGTTWQEAGAGLAPAGEPPQTWIRSLAFAGGTWFLQTGWIPPYQYFGSSTDGDTWEPLTGLPAGEGVGMGSFVHHEGWFYVAIDRSVYASTDGRTGWELVRSGDGLGTTRLVAGGGELYLSESSDAGAVVSVRRDGGWRAIARLPALDVRELGFWGEELVLVTRSHGVVPLSEAPR